MKREIRGWASTNERIKEAGWFDGTEQDWQALPLAERERLAFQSLGCAVAYPTWEPPVDCVHTGCMILRGELPKIAETNRVLRAEAENGWLRFNSRAQLAKVFRAYRKAARETGVYDPWKIAWQGIVLGGLFGEEG